MLCPRVRWLNRWRSSETIAWSQSSRTTWRQWAVAAQSGIGRLVAGDGAANGSWARRARAVALSKRGARRARVGGAVDQSAARQFADVAAIRPVGLLASQLGDVGARGGVQVVAGLLQRPAVPGVKRWHLELPRFDRWCPVVRARRWLCVAATPAGSPGRAWLAPAPPGRAQWPQHPRRRVRCLSARSSLAKCRTRHGRCRPVDHPR